MHFFNYTFTPFGVITVIFAITLSSPDKTDTLIRLFTLAIQFIVNFYVFKNIYKFQKNMNATRVWLVIFNILTASVVFYFITAYWAPSWLLYAMPSSFAATFLNRKKTILISTLSVFSMFFVYWLRSLLLQLDISLQMWAMALSHGLFILTISIFINNMSETMIKMRSNG
ncbi:MAG: hypothetical protein N2Z60_05425 [Elusimicrobiales bacterium]|nr:hypothetical protein [Elusimicrobiales bacterium]